MVIFIAVLFKLLLSGSKLFFQLIVNYFVYTWREVTATILSSTNTQFQIALQVGLRKRTRLYRGLKELITVLSGAQLITHLSELQATTYFFDSAE